MEVLDQVTCHQAGLKFKVLLGIVKIVVTRIEDLNGGERFDDRLRALPVHNRHCAA